MSSHRDDWDDSLRRTPPTRYTIKTVRAVADLSRELSAGLIGVDRRTWGKWENGVNKMPLDVWRQWFDAVRALVHGDFVAARRARDARRV